MPAHSHRAGCTGDGPCELKAISNNLLLSEMMTYLAQPSKGFIVNVLGDARSVASAVTLFETGKSKANYQCPTSSIPPPTELNEGKRR